MMFDPETEDGLYRPVDENDPIWQNPQVAEMRGLAAMDGTVAVWGGNDLSFNVVHLVESDQVMVTEEPEEE